MTHNVDKSKSSKIHPGMTQLVELTNIKMIKKNQIFRHRFFFPIESSFKKESGYIFSQRATCSETDSLYY